MNELQIFKSEEFGEVRTVTINNEPWFVGKDVTVALGYVDTKQAIRVNVADEDKRICLREHLEGVHLQPPKLIITGRLSLMNLDYMRLSLEVGLNQQGGSNTG